jgi:type IV pilus assembly protein PilC
MNLPFLSKEIKLNPNEKLLIIESLSIMLSAGIPILEAFDSIAEDATGKKAKELANGISSEISKGKTLSESMEKYPQTFDEVFLNIVKSGEESGNLDKVLAQLSTDLKSNIETINNIRSALFYPALVIIVLIAVTFYMFAFALPKIAKIFLDLALDLPPYSFFILNSSLFFSEHLLYFIVGFVFFTLFIIWLYTIPKTRHVLFYTLLKIPAIKAFVGYIDLSRFTNTSSLLLQAGVPIIQVFEISRNVVIAPKLRVDIDLMRDSITQGDTLIDAMKKHPKSFPSLLRRLVGVGEETGKLDDSLSKISKHYEKKYTDIVSNITTLLEPILIVLLAVLVGAVLLSVIVPIYQGIGQLSPREGI